MYNVTIPKRTMRTIQCSLNGLDWFNYSYMRGSHLVSNEETDAPINMASNYYSEYISEQVRYYYIYLEDCNEINY